MDRQTRAPIIERKTRLDGSVQDFACERLLLEPGRRAVLRYVLDRDWRLEDAGLVVPRGAVTISHYWMDRPYNVYHWLAGGHTLAYYCNVAEQTEISEDLVAYTDLVVDVLLRPSGETLVLDEEELPADLDARRRGLVARATEAIVTNGRRIAAEVERESRLLA
ncbi:MAG TPA: DUF402 domain-containing protein [Candidatus Limnocylindrales bacterium]|nr:DUF402 domain-containing protein [Candidatus Limnocylindrales bacterium]